MTLREYQNNLISKCAKLFHWRSSINKYQLIKCLHNLLPYHPESLLHCYLASWFISFLPFQHLLPGWLLCYQATLLPDYLVNNSALWTFSKNRCATKFPTECLAINNRFPAKIFLWSLVNNFGAVAAVHSIIVSVGKKEIHEEVTNDVFHFFRWAFLLDANLFSDSLTYYVRHTCSMRPHLKIFRTF